MNYKYSILTFFVILLLAAAPPAMAADLETLSIYPDKLNLNSKRAKAQLIVLGEYSDGVVRDLTREVKYFTGGGFSGGAFEIFGLTTEGLVTASADGKGVLTAKMGDHQATINVTVSGTRNPDPVRFRSEALAVITKQGCNAGSCHGSPEGKGGFSLSLFAFDPVLDKKSLVRSGLNRRTNVFEPEQSLILKKPMLRVPHVGGKKLRKTDVAYTILRDWIHEGCNDDPVTEPICVNIEVFPGENRILFAPFHEQQLSVRAHFDDGSIRDVTDIATYTISHSDVIGVTADGLVQGKTRGQSAVTVRYMEHLQSVHFTICEDVEGFKWPEVEENSFVDSLVNKRLQLLQYAPSATCSDEVFIRRLYLDLTGLLPSINVTRKFLQDKSETKRSDLINKLLESRAFAHFQSLRIADLMRVNPKVLTDGRAELFSEWLTNAVFANMPFDELAEKVLTARGDSRFVPEANYIAAINDPKDLTESTAQVFMGSRIQCAKCHNHPFENWTQNDYYSIGSVFVGINHVGPSIGISSSGGMSNPTTGKAMAPWGMEDDRVELFNSGQEIDPREDFSNWLTSDTNPFFARVEVNRIWAHLLGRGIVEPIDDFRSSNPASNVDLLEALAQDFIKSGYDRKHMYRLICNSQTYQRTTVTTEFNETDDSLFSHATARLLTAEQLQDAIGYTTGVLQPIEQIDQVIASTRDELQLVQKELDSAFNEWQQEYRRRFDEAAFVHGRWWLIGPFKAGSHEEAQMKELIDESEPVDLTQEIEGKKWLLQTDWENNRTNTFTDKNIGAAYSYHEVMVNRPCKIRITCTADDGLRIIHNGKRIYDKNQIIDVIEERIVEFSMGVGTNRFLIKPINKGGAFHFTVNFTYLEDNEGDANLVSDIPDYHAHLIRLGDKRTNSETNILREYYYTRDGRIPVLRNRIRQGGRNDYSTQRPYPQRSDFLKAFGQPERMSACVCERTDEPTLEQALQLLNGRHVYDQVNASAEKHQELTDIELTEHLYLAALSRYPTKHEQTIVAEFITKHENRDDAIRDLIWALVNTAEFMFQH